MHTRPLSLPLCFGVLLVGLSSASAKEQLRDEWTASFEAGVKTHWDHEEIWKTGEGYERGYKAWRKGARGLVVFESSMTTDGSGRVLTYRWTRRAWWGKAEFELGPADGDVLMWRSKVRDLKERSGIVEGGRAWSSEILGVRVMKGELPPGKREVEVLDLSKKDGLQSKELEFSRSKQGWSIKIRTGESLRKADGTFLSRFDPESPFRLVLPATAKNAADLTIKGKLPELPESAELDAVEVGGVRVKRLDPTWTLKRIDDERMQGVGIETGGVELAALVLPMSLPEDSEARLAFAESMRKGMNNDAESKFGEPKVGSFRGKEGIELELKSSDADDKGGVAYLLPHAGRTLMLMIAWPLDLAEKFEKDRERVLSAFELAKAAPAPDAWKRVEVKGAGVGLKIPASWVPAPTTPKIMPSHWTSPMRASQVNVTKGVLAGFDLPQAQKMWVANQQQNPALKGIRVEVQEEVTVSGRKGFKTIVVGTLDNQGVKTGYRAASLAFLAKDNGYVEVTVVAFGLDWKLEDLDRVLKSVRFVKSF